MSLKPTTRLPGEGVQVGALLRRCIGLLQTSWIVLEKSDSDLKCRIPPSTDFVDANVAYNNFKWPVT
jgi:hypothetical protein